MEELLGLSDADFEGVEDEETVEFEENRPGEPSHISRSSNPPSEPDKSTHLANAKNTVEKPSETRVLSSRPLGSSSPRVDAVASSVSPSVSLGMGFHGYIALSRQICLNFHWVRFDDCMPWRTEQFSRM